MSDVSNSNISGQFRGINAALLESDVTIKYKDSTDVRLLEPIVHVPCVEDAQFFMPNAALTWVSQSGVSLAESWPPAGV